MKKIRPLPSPSPRIATRRVAGELFAIPTAKSASEMKSIYSFNEVGALVWENLKTTRNMEDMTKLILDEYDADENQIKHDILTFLEEAKAEGLLQEASD